ncbi:MAG: GNAT family N-acetyltransferase [Novosphingobium sp.]|nr:GNAT family N-acetyltransferase [Novosphingobium sp.]
MGNPSLRTKRLHLRRWRDEDRAAYAAICADPDVMRYIGDGSTRTPEQASRAIDQFEQDWDAQGLGLFAVEMIGTGKLIGFTGFSRPDFMPSLLPSVEIGWRFAKAQWGKGLATESANAALAFARDLPVEEDIVSVCQCGNAASVRIMEKIGLEFDHRGIDPTCAREVEVYRLPR